MAYTIVYTYSSIDASSRHSHLHTHTSLCDNMYMRIHNNSLVHLSRLCCSGVVDLLHCVVYTSSIKVCRILAVVSVYGGATADI